MLNVNNVLIGSDPEMFLVDKDGHFRSSVGLIGGTKDKPLPINDLGDMVQEDNVSVEFNIAPTNSKEVFTASILRVIDYVNGQMGRHGLTTKIEASAIFTDKELDTPQAQTFGCDPDYSCWTLEANPRPKAKNSNLRSCGGHIHIGWEAPEMQERVEVARAMELFVALPSVKFDKDSRRRELYGKSGACRWKYYGVEHRTVSNWWLRSEDSIKFVFDQSMKAVKFVTSGKEIAYEDIDDIIHSINSGNVELANKLIGKYNVC